MTASAQVVIRPGGVIAVTVSGGDHPPHTLAHRLSSDPAQVAAFFASAAAFLRARSAPVFPTIPEGAIQ
ncbi:hypothetical protein [Bradyrhizobium sp.]|uniref:hypothetical protein n=1 Tax=Bradyrhizobium sp. TaxID=376 RepID=UPI0025C6D875|nr:hypothetical protein [Bradyrhizobium sp.]MCA3256252.1 hypothetical protein [Alphaproteobacteria bacterium]MCA3570687.1 hypothetical protein [Bradyrhizobium sp.]